MPTELDGRERALYEAALEVETDERLNAEMAEWDVTVGDGIEEEPADPDGSW